jgi:hypothetical protein
MLARRNSTVLALIWSSAAISGFVRPRSTVISTSSSRSVRGSIGWAGVTSRSVAARTKQCGSIASCVPPGRSVGQVDLSDLPAWGDAQPQHDGPPTNLNRPTWIVARGQETSFPSIITINQACLAAAIGYILIPSLMVAASLMLPAWLNGRVNIGVGLVYPGVDRRAVHGRELELLRARQLLRSRSVVARWPGRLALAQMVCRLITALQSTGELTLATNGVITVLRYESSSASSMTRSGSSATRVVERSGPGDRRRVQRSTRCLGD